MTQSISSILSTASDTAQLRVQAANGNQVDDEVIQQFEALFLQHMLKSMRTASLAEGLFQSEQSEFYRDMYDQQIAADLAGKGILGIAHIINRQLGRAPQASDAAINIDAKDATALNTGLPLDQANIARRDAVNALTQNKLKVEGEANIRAEVEAEAVDLARLDRFIDRLSQQINDSDVTQQASTESIKPLAFRPESPREFVEVAYRYAQAPAEKLGVDPQVLVAISALETGWGKHIPQDGSGSSNNYFGIKADNRWQGEQVGSQTLEFEQGAFKGLKQFFRSYESVKESFNDYANFLLSNDRYSYALEYAGDSRKFLTEIQQAGYATDPKYADKIMSILNSQAFTLPR